MIYSVKTILNDKVSLCSCFTDKEQAIQKCKTHMQIFNQYNIKQGIGIVTDGQNRIVYLNSDVISQQLFS